MSSASDFPVLYTTVLSDLSTQQTCSMYVFSLRKNIHVKNMSTVNTSILYKYPH